MRTFSERSQKIVVWWALVFTAIYGFAMAFLLHIMPPPKATWNYDQIAHWYSIHHDSIRVGAIVASYTSAFMLPLACVVAVQMAREEPGGKIWTILTIAGGAMMSIFLVLPPLFFGVAAFTPSRSHEVTGVMHELAMLTLTTTDQFYVFMWVAIVVICLIPKTAKHSPFPRWFGYFTAWIAFMFEAGAIAFLPRTGPFSWRGLLVFWSPLTLFGLWITVMSVLLLKALNQQIREKQSEPRDVAVAA
jgi:hypothetical protein